MIVISGASTGISLLECGSTASMASSRAMAPSRFCSPSSPKVTGVGNSFPASRRWSDTTPAGPTPVPGAASSVGTGDRGLAALPAEPATLLLHLQHLAEEGKGRSALRSAASAISAAHRAAGLGGGKNPAAHEDVRDFLQGVERTAPPERQAAAMLSEVISAVRATARLPRKGRGGRMETAETAEARTRVDVALVLTLRDGGLRVSEAAALTWRDVERWPGGSGRLAIVRSKTDQGGEGAVVAITPACLRALGRHPAGGGSSGGQGCSGCRPAR